MPKKMQGPSNIREKKPLNFKVNVAELRVIEAYAARKPGYKPSEESVTIIQND